MEKNEGERRGGRGGGGMERQKVDKRAKERETKSEVGKGRRRTGGERAPIKGTVVRRSSRTEYKEL